MAGMRLKTIRDAMDGAEVLEVPLVGQTLLDCALLNKGAAFCDDERRELDLLGLLPPHVETLEEQTARVYEEYQAKDSDLERHIFLRGLQDLNEVLFYRVLREHIAEMTPIVYTPTVGLGCQRYSHIFRRPRGLFITYPQREYIETVLENRPYEHVEVIVVSDGERILGLGDQGAGGMGIPVGKLALYSLMGGIHPATTLPVLLDVGTDNQERLDDPMYMGWRHARVRGQEYDDFVEAFVQAVIQKLPHALLQWEDFAQTNASRLLQRYRNRLCAFNDDIQGTAAVTMGTLLAAIKVAGSQLCNQRIAVLGAGSAGCGISAQLVAAMRQEGLSEAEARSRFWLIDRSGLLRQGLTNLLPFQEEFVQPRERLAGWELARSETIDLKDVVTHVHPTILIGTSGQPGVFTEEVIRDMAQHVPRPIILPLSNPTSRCEAQPEDLIAWTDGRALIATGSPFGDVAYQGRRIRIAQCNNSCIFPAMGLGVLSVRARQVTESMFMAASHALAECSPALGDPQEALLPPLEDIRRVSRRIALAVAAEAQRQGVAESTSAEGLERLVDAKMWTPHYVRLKRRAG